MNARIIRPDGKTENVVPADGLHFSLQELQSIVDGLIQIVHLDEETLLVINEEGKWMGLKENPTATLIYHKFRPLTHDFIVGVALLCDISQIE